MKDNSRLLVIGAGIVMLRLLLAFNGISLRSSTPRTSGANPKQPQTQAPNSGRAPASVTPILDTGRSPAQDKDGSLVNATQIGRTATKLAQPNPATSLASGPPFNNEQTRHPGAFQPARQPNYLNAIQPPTAP